MTCRPCTLTGRPPTSRHPNAGRAVGPLCEPVERRRLMSVSGWTADSISELTGSYDAVVMFGDNGNPVGTPTAELTRSDSALAYSYSIWDSDLDDGLDSGWVTVQLAINTGGNGGGSYEVADVGQGTFSTPGASAGIGHVTIQAAVTGAFMAVEWRYVTVEFYRAGQLVETATPGGPSADTMNATSNDPAESVTVLSASGSDYDGVYVSAQVRLQTAPGTYPTQTDVFGHILIS